MHLFNLDDRSYCESQVSIGCCLVVALRRAGGCVVLSVHHIWLLNDRSMLACCSGGLSMTLCPLAAVSASRSWPVHAWNTAKLAPLLTTPLGAHVQVVQPAGRLLRPPQAPK